MQIITDLVKRITQDGLTLADILRHQHQYHEGRRWSVFELLKGRKLTAVSERDRAALWHVSRAEITTQPAGIRLATQGTRDATNLHDANPLGATILHASAAWSARYWLEEEAHHEVAYGFVAEMVGIPPIPQDELVAHRGSFPDDNYVRVCVLQACVEIEAVMTYGQISRDTSDPLIRDVFQHIARDEVQHRQYFISFAKALVDSHVFPIKDVLSMAYMWVRPHVGEMMGSQRERQTSRKGFVNWWENVIHDADDPRDVWKDKAKEQQVVNRKVTSVFAAVEQITDLRVRTVAELERVYLASLKTSDADRLRHAIGRSSSHEASAV